jgi:hypothetical protein
MMADVSDPEAQDYAIVHGHLDDQHISAESDFSLGSKCREVLCEILDLLLLVGLFMHTVFTHIYRVLWETDIHCCFLEQWTMLILLPRSVRDDNVSLAVKD